MRNTFVEIVEEAKGKTKNFNIIESILYIKEGKLFWWTIRKLSLENPTKNLKLKFLAVFDIIVYKIINYFQSIKKIDNFNFLS